MGAGQRSGRLATVLVLVLSGLVACGGAEGRLEKLRGDPMASYELPSAVSTRTSEIVGGYSGVSSPSMIRRSFTVPPGEAEAAMSEIAEAAVESGWDVAPNEFAGYSGDKKIDDIIAQISITGIVSDDIVWFELYSRSDR